MSGKRWLFYAPNGFGLGHVSQSMALARQIKAQAPDSRILFLTDCEATNLMWREGFATVKTIALHSVRKGLMDEETARALNQATALSTYRTFRPDVMVTDTFPLGRTGELAGILPNPSKRVLLTREVKPAVRDTPEYQRRLALYDQVLVMHHPGEVDFTLPEGVGRKEVGYLLLRSDQEVLPREEARRRLGLPQEGFVLYVGFGGGGDQKYSAFLNWVLQEARRFPDWTLACSMPPFYEGEIPRVPNLRIQRLVYYPLLEVMRAFDAAVTALGLNMMAELFHCGIPSAFLPRLDMDDDHEGRGRRIEAAKAGWMIWNSKPEFRRRLFDSMADPAIRARVGENARRVMPENGAEKAAAYLLDLYG